MSLSFFFFKQWLLRLEKEKIKFSARKQRPRVEKISIIRIMDLFTFKVKRIEAIKNKIIIFLLWLLDTSQYHPLSKQLTESF